MKDYNHLLSPEERAALLCDNGEGSISETPAAGVLQHKAELAIQQELTDLREALRLMTLRMEFMENLLQGHLKDQALQKELAPAAATSDPRRRSEGNTAATSDSRRRSGENTAATSDPRRRSEENAAAKHVQLPPRSIRHGRVRRSLS